MKRSLKEQLLRIIYSGTQNQRFKKKLWRKKLLKHIKKYLI